MGLLLVVHTLHLLAVPILVLWVGLEKKVSKKNLDARIFFFFGKSHILSVTLDATKSVTLYPVLVNIGKYLHK